MAPPKVPINASTSGSDPEIQSQITTALLQNGGVKRIQDALKQRLDEENWSQNLRHYVVQLFRSGEASTYDEAWGKVMGQIRGGGDAGVDLSVPLSAREGGAEAVKRELVEICVMDK